MQQTNESRRAPWWDFVGMALALDKRVIVVLPLVFVVAHTLAKAPGVDILERALFATPSLLLRWAEMAWA